MRFTELALQTRLALHALQGVAAFSIASCWMGTTPGLALALAALAVLCPPVGPLLGLSCGLMVWSWL